MHTSIANFNPLNHEREKVKELIPEFLQESAANLISFMEQYYEYLNREGYASYELEHVIDESDIDQVSSKYLDSIQGEIAKIVPNSSVIDRKTLYKRIVHYYRIKGTPESIDVFFQILFDTFVDVYYPGDNLFKLSAGTYDSPSSNYSKVAGFLSGSDKIQDSEFWQDFSYQIRSSITADRWQDAYNRLVHPAGMKFFVLVVIELIVENRWDEFLTYEGTPSNPEAYFESLIPPRLQEGGDIYGSSHTPKYQLGWLSQIISTFIEISVSGLNPLKNPFRNNIVRTPIQRGGSEFRDASSTGFFMRHDFDISQMTVVVLPLSTPIKYNEQIKIGFTLDYGWAETDLVKVTLLRDLYDTPDGASFGINSGRALAVGGTDSHNGYKIPDQASETTVTLTSKDNDNRAIAFMALTGTDANYTVRDFRVIDITHVDDENESQPSPVDNTDRIESDTDKHYNRKQNLQREMLLLVKRAIGPNSRLTTRDAFAHNNYFANSTSFWDEVRSIAKIGYANIPLSVLTSQFGYESNTTNPYSNAVVTREDLLDVFTDNDRVAYSLRALSTLSGDSNAVRVRNDSNEYAIIEYAGQGIDVDALLAHTGNGDGYVGTWYDRTGNGRHATQTNTNYQPKIVENGVYLGEIRFDGTDDHLLCETDLFDTDDLLSVHLVAKLDDTSTRRQTLVSYIYNIQADAAASNGFAIEQNLYGIGYLGGVTDAGYWPGTPVYNEDYTVGSNISSSNYILHTLQLNNSTISLYNNSSLVDSDSTAGMESTRKAFWQRLRIGGAEGGNQAMEGAIKELIIYNSDQSSNRTNIENDINEYYDIYS